MKLCKKDKVKLSKIERLLKQTQTRLDDAPHGLDVNYYHAVKQALNEYRKMFRASAYKKARMHEKQEEKHTLEEFIGSYDLPNYEELADLETELHRKK